MKPILIICALLMACTGCITVREANYRADMRYWDGYSKVLKDWMDSQKRERDIIQDLMKERDECREASKSAHGLQQPVPLPFYIDKIDWEKLMQVK